MKRQFGLPAAFALTLLAFLLFGFTPSHPLKLSPPDQDVVIDYAFPSSLPPEVVEELDRSASTTTTASLPSQPETFTRTEQGDFSFAPLSPSLVDRRSLPPVISLDPRTLSPGDGGSGVSVPNGPMDASGLDNPPRASVQTPPAYPPNARAAGLGGEVWVEFAVDESGRVLRARVVRSSDPMFDEPTLRAVAKWRFEPGRKQGRPVSFRMVVPVNYRLSD